MLSNREIRARYGKDAVISRKGNFVLVHLDHPDRKTIQDRWQEFDPATYFFDDCPLCAMLKEGGVVIFDDSIFNPDEDVDL